LGVERTRTVSLVRDWLNYAPATLHRDASTMRGSYGWVQAIGAVRENPAMLVCTPAVHNRQPRPVSDGTFTKLWGTLDGADAIVLGLAFFCGLRREEITRLRVGTVDVGRRKLVNCVRKGGGEDTLPIGTMLDTFERRLPHLGAERLWPFIVERTDGRDRAKFLIGWSDLGRPRRSVASALREVDALDPNHLNHWLDAADYTAASPKTATPHRGNTKPRTTVRTHRNSHRSPNNHSLHKTGGASSWRLGGGDRVRWHGCADEVVCAGPDSDDGVVAVHAR
jgi:integrase